MKMMLAWCLGQDNTPITPHSCTRALAAGGEWTRRLLWGDGGGDVLVAGNRSRRMLLLLSLLLGRKRCASSVG